MYINIGKDLVVNDENIVGIFNLDYVRNTKEYRNFLSQLEENKQVERLVDNAEKTMILTQNRDRVKAYITNIGSATIGKRKKRN